MDKVDQFESAFRSATKAVFHYQRLALRSVLIVTDLDPAAATKFSAEVQRFTAALGDQAEVSYVTLTGDRFASPRDLLQLVEEQRPDLVVTYRCLHSEAWRWGFTLGTYIDVLAQATATPVLLLPHPARTPATGLPSGTEAPGMTDRVMAITDHLAGDERLVNAALAFAEPDGTLFLSHVEANATFERYIEIIGKIPEIETDFARESIRAQLLKEPHDYIRSVGEALSAANIRCAIQATVTMGHHVQQYLELITTHEIDLLVLHTKDEGHNAMHGLAYPLAIELRDTPLLLL